MRWNLKDYVRFLVFENINLNWLSWYGDSISIFHIYMLFEPIWIDFDTKIITLVCDEFINPFLTIMDFYQVYWSISLDIFINSS